MEIYIIRASNKAAIAAITHTSINRALTADQKIALNNLLYREESASKPQFRGKPLHYSPVADDGKQIIMPRFMAYIVEKFCKENNISCSILCTNFMNKFASNEADFGELRVQLWQDKLAMIDDIYKQLCASNGLIIKLDTGKGKTVIISELLRRIGKRGIIFVKNSELQLQMANDLKTNLSIGDSDICFIGGDLAKLRSNSALLTSRNYKIAIMIINSARKFSTEFYDTHNIAIFDECHSYVSEKNSKIFNICQVPYMVGTSANPDKFWNHKLICHNIGAIMDCNAYVESKKANAVVNLVRFYGDREHTRVITSKIGTMSVAKMVQQFMGDEERNNMIVDMLAMAVKDYKHGFAFAMRNDYLYKLCSLMKIRYPEIVCVVFCADTTKADKEIARTTANIIFINYAYTEGINILHMRFLALISPYKENGTQITGRILRGDLTDMRCVYDIIDMNTPLASQYHTRKQVYFDRGFTVREFDSHKKT